MNRIYDHKVLYKVLEPIEIVLNYFEYKSDDKEFEKTVNYFFKSQLLDEHVEMKNKKYEKYQFDNVTNFQNNMKKELYSLFVKLQRYSRSSFYHFFAVKIFLTYNKVVLALKSLRFLNQNSANSVNYFQSLILFKRYLSANKVEDALLKLIYQYEPNLENLEECENMAIKQIQDVVDNFNSKGDLVEMILTKVILLKIQNSVSDIALQEMFDLIFNLSQLELRKIKFRVYF